MARSKPTKWSDLFTPGNAGTAGKGPAGSSADEKARQDYLRSLRLRAPAQWTSPHLTEEMRLRGAVYVASKVLESQAAASELHLFRWHESARLSNDQKAREPLEPGHPLYRLLRRPNTSETLGMLLRRLVQQINLTGTALAWRVDDDFEPRELWGVPTGTYQPVAPGPLYPEGAYRILPYWPGPYALLPGIWRQGGVIVPAEQMLAVRYPHPLLPAHEGLSPLSACNYAMDTIEGIDQARMNKVRSGINPSAVAEFDPSVQLPDGDDLERMREELKQVLGGPDNAGKVAMLSAGMKLNPWGDDNVEVGWIESWGQLVGLVLSVYGVTKSLAFMDDAGAFAALYASLKQFDLFTLVPLLTLFSDALNLQLVWPYYGEDICCELQPRKIENEEEKDKRAEILGKFGSLTHNELRVALGFPPIEEEWGKDRVSEKGGEPPMLGPDGKPLPPGMKPPAPGQPPRNPIDKDREDNEEGGGSLPDKKPLPGKKFAHVNGNGRM